MLPCYSAEEKLELICTRTAVKYVSCDCLFVEVVKSNHRSLRTTSTVGDYLAGMMSSDCQLPNELVRYNVSV